MAVDLYKALGLNKKADKKSIKAAYRSRAKELHPDKGGSVEKFGQIQRAHDILMDDERRAKYDATGDIDEKQPNNEHSNAINVVAGSLAVVLGDCANKGQSPLEKDIVDLVRRVIGSNIEEAQKRLRILKNILESDKKLHGRFKSKKENIFDALIANRVIMINTDIRSSELVIKSNKDALELIKGCTFKSDKPEREQRIGNFTFTVMG